MAREGMVDALKEAWRILSPKGVLIDLRPYPARDCPIDVVKSWGTLRVGEVDASEAADDDAAADGAIATLVAERWFLPGRQEVFDFELYWDSVAELEGFMTGSRRMGEVRPRGTELEVICREHLAPGCGRGRLRVTRPMLLSVYCKVIPAARR